jgi:hypothetical protein
MPQEARYRNRNRLRRDAGEMSELSETRMMRIVDELAEAAQRVGLEVRREKIMREIGYRTRGGACRLRDKNLVIIDRDQPAAEQLEVIAEALRSRDLESVYLSPAARRIVHLGDAST